VVGWRECSQHHHHCPARLPRLQTALIRISNEVVLACAMTRG
jgi:hypothetical protein